jgi:hypothetical protein
LSCVVFDDHAALAAERGSWFTSLCHPV